LDYRDLEAAAHTEVICNKINTNGYP
jgi:hypothetical protein